MPESTETFAARTRRKLNAICLRWLQLPVDEIVFLDSVFERAADTLTVLELKRIDRLFERVK